MPGEFLFTVRESLNGSPRTRIVRLDLGSQDFRFAAGQSVLAGLGRQNATKPYSIACSPKQARASHSIELLVRIDGSEREGVDLGFAAPGSEVSVRGPAGSFVLPCQIDEPHLLLIAGGSGIAPLRAQAWEAIERRTPLRITLIYSARTPDDFCYEEELTRLHEQQRIRLIQTVTRFDGEQWKGRRGRVDRSWLSSVATEARTLCCVCGPNEFVEDVCRTLAECGVSEERIRRDLH